MDFYVPYRDESQDGHSSRCGKIHRSLDPRNWDLLEEVDLDEYYHKLRYAIPRIVFLKCVGHDIDLDIFKTENFTTRSLRKENAPKAMEILRSIGWGPEPAMRDYNEFVKGLRGREFEPIKPPEAPAIFYKELKKKMERFENYLERQKTGDENTVLALKLGIFYYTRAFFDDMHEKYDVKLKIKWFKMFNETIPAMKLAVNLIFTMLERFRMQSSLDGKTMNQITKSNQFAAIDELISYVNDVVVVLDKQLQSSPFITGNYVFEPSEPTVAALEMEITKLNELCLKLSRYGHPESLREMATMTRKWKSKGKYIRYFIYSLPTLPRVRIN